MNNGTDWRRIVIKISSGAKIQNLIIVTAYYYDEFYKNQISIFYRLRDEQKFFH